MATSRRTNKPNRAKTADLSELFDVVSPDEIRIRGTRIGVEVILEEAERAMSVAAILREYPSLTRNQVTRTLAYYRAHRAELDDYMRRLEEHGRRMAEEQARRHPELVERLRKAAAEAARRRASTGG